MSTYGQNNVNGTQNRTKFQLGIYFILNKNKVGIKLEFKGSRKGNFFIPLKQQA